MRQNLIHQNVFNFLLKQIDEVIRVGPFRIFGGKNDMKTRVILIPFSIKYTELAKPTHQ
jgi:hypothetical protein